MIKKIFPIVTGGLMLVQVAGNAAADVKTLVKDNTAFAIDLYQKLRTSSEGNIFFSPYSISTALAMTYAGARGDTEKQMTQVLHFSLDQKNLHPTFAELEQNLNQVQKKGNVNLCIANSLWPQKDYIFLKDYLSVLKQSYGTSVSPMDYKNAAEPARQAINKWVEGKTSEKIRDLIQPGVLDQLTRLVLVNAIYFKGNWAEQFKTSNTQNAPFFLLSGKSVQALLMNQKHKFRYTETDSEQVLELPYAGNQLSMLVILPKQKKGLPELEKRLNEGSIGRWNAALTEQEIVVFLPKFKMTSQFLLNQALVAMGMPDAFCDKADFSGMDGRKDLYISAAIHKAFVDVNEEGTEAAAATAVVMRFLSAMPPQLEIFRADHPFIFLIRENVTGSILFIGRVMDPTNSGE